MRGPVSQQIGKVTTKKIQCGVCEVRPALARESPGGPVSARCGKRLQFLAIRRRRCRPRHPPPSRFKSQRWSRCLTTGHLFHSWRIHFLISCRESPNFAAKSTIAHAMRAQCGKPPLTRHRLTKVLGQGLLLTNQTPPAYHRVWTLSPLKRTASHACARAQRSNTSL